jgi:hypothetical protein
LIRGLSPAALRCHLLRRLLNLSIHKNKLGDEMTSTSEVEVTQISKHGIWLLLKEKEHFLSLDNFPWFKDASVSSIQNVELLNEHHLYWPDLDIDLVVDSINNTERYPLISR